MGDRSGGVDRLGGASGGALVLAEAVSSGREVWQTVSVERVLDVGGEFDDSGGASLGLDNPQVDCVDVFASLLELVEANPYTVRAYRRAAGTIRARRSRSPSWRGLGACVICAGSGRDRGASSSRPVRSPSWRHSSGSSRPISSASATSGLARTVRSTSRGRSVSVPPPGFARRPPAGRAGDRAKDRGAAARGAGPRGRAATAPRTLCSTGPGSSSAASRPHWTARR